MLAEYGWWTLLYGTLAAWVSAIVAVRWMVHYLKKNGMEIFGYYRVVLAIVVGTCLTLGILKEQRPEPIAGSDPTELHSLTPHLDPKID